MYTFGIINPSMAIRPFCESRYDRACDFLKARGNQIIEGKLVNNVNEIYRSGTITKRVEEFHEIIKNPEVDIVLISIGGLNTASILELLDYQLIEETNKIYLAYSDGTSLLNAIATKTNCRVIYGHSLSSTYGELGDFPDLSYQNLIKVLENDDFSYQKPQFFTKEYVDWNEQEEVKEMEENKWIIQQGGKCSGRLIGGNLSTLVTLAGTKYLIPRKDGDILFLENEGIDISNLERQITQLYQIGYFEKLSGIIFGKYEFIKDYGLKRHPVDVLYELGFDKTIPVLIDFDCGHTFPSLALELMRNYELDLDKEEISLKTLNN